MKINLTLNRKWKRREIIILLEQLGLYVSSGLPIDRALSIIGENGSKARIVTIMKMKSAIESGAAFSRTYTENISRAGTVVSILEQGESSGDLGRAFHSAKLLLERGDELSKKCLSALAYPMIIGVFAVLLTIGLVRGVMPQIIPLLKSLHVKLPLLTRVVIFLSDGFLVYGMWIAASGLIGGIGGIVVYKKFLHVRRVVHKMLLVVPLIGGVIQSYWFALFLRSCGTLVESGTSISVAYSSASAGISLIPFRLKLQMHSGSMYEGVSLASVLSAKNMKFPPYIPALISAGESSGTLGSSLLRAADIIDRDIEHMLKRLTSLIEPVMMAGMGCVVGAIALSIMMPIYDISRVLQR
ncbi:MAG: type II secretion system F family protein [Patescibacteria group bacterium]